MPQGSHNMGVSRGVQGGSDRQIGSGGGCFVVVTAVAKVSVQGSVLASKRTPGF